MLWHYFSYFQYDCGQDSDVLPLTQGLEGAKVNNVLHLAQIDGRRNGGRRGRGVTQESHFRQILKFLKIFKSRSLSPNPRHKKRFFWSPALETNDPMPENEMAELSAYQPIVLQDPTIPSLVEELYAELCAGLL